MPLVDLDERASERRLLPVSLHQSKKRCEREWREAERAAQCAEKTDQDINATKADVEKVSTPRGRPREVKASGYKLENTFPVCSLNSGV